ncbi:MAG TPA: zinc ribbon domain-containing protein [Thermodesulforhabdus norvegica]|uniref:Zinc ribbon domain-containing protein n=1 Tax=Thermodesulforhabdus norvegica TaxID=39841 RepID=A0A7C0WQZ3_9BACT|nr:zinc ribbon domain-containing protein [Deltaproteobacteria bacterium]MBW2068607.1 zinc ribbon domain-containing protein [Deltaproteobacteria bacterium]HDL89269.1 zinc ribbon domain-containing protein [Thermodesulforhabdus norvegica]
MPTYQYECTECGHQFEVKHSIKDDSPKLCPLCNGTSRRIITGGIGFIMKGAGRSGNGECHFGRTGTTCCGRNEPCGRCGDGKRGW